VDGADHINVTARINVFGGVRQRSGARCRGADPICIVAPPAGQSEFIQRLAAVQIMLSHCLDGCKRPKKLELLHGTPRPGSSLKRS
jgi:hypothetical protein